MFRGFLIWRCMLEINPATIKDNDLKNSAFLQIYSTWEIQSHYWKRQVLAHIISMYCVNDGKSCSCVTWELKRKDSWSRSLSVSRPSVFQRVTLSHGHFCPLESREQLWVGCAMACSWAHRQRENPGAHTAARMSLSMIPLCLSPVPSFPTCFYAFAQIDCGTFISSSATLQQGTHAVNLWLDYVPLWVTS